MYCSPFSLIAYFTKFICVCYRINFTGGQWKKAVKRENINQWSRVAAGIVHFCTWIVVCCTCLGLTIKNLAVVLRSASGSLRCWLQKTRCCWASITLKPCCHRDNHLARGPHTCPWLGKNVLWKKVYLIKMQWLVWVIWFIGKCWWNFVNNNLLWKVKVFSVKLFETEGYSPFNLEMIC